MEIDKEINANFKDNDDRKSFLEISEYLKKFAGINLSENEKDISLAFSRVRRLEKAHGNISFKQVVKKLKSNNKPFIQDFISVFTTNTTHFFRESAHFDYLNKFMPSYIEKKSKNGPCDLKIWCAATSTGQEAYTLAMVLSDLLEGTGGKFKILASDIDPVVINKAKQGIYDKSLLKKVPEKFSKKYLESVDSERMKITNELKSNIKFSTFNLLNIPYPFKGKFDVIFCRNVFIYFERNTISNIVLEMRNFMHKDALLFVGHSETLSLPIKGIVRNIPAVYQLKETP